MAKSVFPPGTTMELARDMKDPAIMDDRYGKSIPRGFANLMTVMDSSAVGIERAVKGLDVSTMGTR